MTERRRRPPPAITQLLNELRAVLRQAHDSGVLKTAPEQIFARVKCADEVPRDPSARDAWAIVGGPKDTKRRRRAECLERADGAWLHFTLTVGATAKGPIVPASDEVLAYDFELVLRPPPDGAVATEAHFVRIDKNLPGHKNDAERGLRCHLHPSDDDLQLPWVDTGPVEALKLLLTLKPIKER